MASSFTDEECKPGNSTDPNFAHSSTYVPAINFLGERISLGIAPSGSIADTPQDLLHYYYHALAVFIFPQYMSIIGFVTND